MGACAREVVHIGSEVEVVPQGFLWGRFNGKKSNLCLLLVMR